MTRAVQEVWRRDLLALSQSLQEDLTGLHGSRPPLETAETLDVFVQGLVLSWKDMGFSDDAIGQALRAGAERDFDLDPAWEEQRIQRQAWAAASEGSFGQSLNKIQGVGVAATVLGFVGMIPSGAFWSWQPARLILLVCVAIFFSGIGLAWLATRIQVSRQAHHLEKLRRGPSNRTK